MNDSTYHTVSTISWDTRFDDKGLAHRLQDRLGDWSRNRMMAEISAVFDKLCPPDQIWRIPSLELDLGIMDWTNLERNLEERFQRVLRKQLQDLLLYAGIGDKEIEILEGARAQVEIIKHYLIHGYLPWNHEGLSGTINALMAHQFQVNPVGLGSMLERVGSQYEGVRKRMAWQLDETNILGIIRVLEPDHHQQITDLSNELSTIREKESIVQSNQADFKRNLWLWVLTYLYTDRGTLFNRVAFMKHNILHMAKHYHLSFEALFSMIEGAVEAVGKKRKITADFLLAIQAIGREMKFIRGLSGGQGSPGATLAEEGSPGATLAEEGSLGATLAEVGSPGATEALPANVTRDFSEGNVWTQLLDLASGNEPTFRALVEAVDAGHTETSMEGLLVLKEKLEGAQAVDAWCDLLGADYPASVRTAKTMSVLLTLIDQVCADRERIVFELIRILDKGIREGNTRRILKTSQALQFLLLRTSQELWRRFPEKKLLDRVWPYIGTPALEAHLGVNERSGLSAHLGGDLRSGLAPHLDGDLSAAPAGPTAPSGPAGHAETREEQCLSILELAKRSGQWTNFTDTILLYGQMPEGFDWDDRAPRDGALPDGAPRDGATQERAPMSGAAALIKTWLSTAPSDFITSVGNKALPKRQMEWLASVISFKDLTRAIGQTERGLQPMLKSLEAFYRGLGQCAIGPVSSKELQGILFWKVMKAWRSKQWRALTPVFLWNKLVWDLSMKRGLDPKVVENYFRTKNAHFPYPIGSASPKPPKKELDIILPLKGNAKEVIQVKNAGLVLLNAYMVMMFERLGLCKDKQWIGQDQALEGVHYLQFLVTGHSRTEEHLLPLNKLLCGLSMSHPVAEGITISENHKGLMEGLIKAVIGYWPVIGASTIEGFRGNWLVRDGLLSESEDRWDLKVEKRPYDILIDKSPFTFSIIRLPWMKKPLHVKWT
jgi:hypothetical protein